MKNTVKHQGFRLIVEWWDAERQKTVRVCNRIFRTQRGADNHLRYYVERDRENYRGSIQFLGY